MQHLTKHELQKLLAVARSHSERDWLILLLSYNHALRVSEVTALTASNIRDGYLCFDRLKGSQSGVHELFPSDGPHEARGTVVPDQPDSSRSVNQEVLPVGRHP